MDTYNNLVLFGNIMEASACIAGFLYWKRLKPSYWKVVPIYLLIIVICELSLKPIFRIFLNIDQNYIYGYFVVPLEFFFFYYLYYKILQKSFHKIIIGIALLYLMLLIGERILLPNVWYRTFTFSYNFGNLSVLSLFIIYILTLISSEEVISFKKDPFFWINIGALLFYVGTIPYYVTLSFLYKTNFELFYILLFVRSILMYLLYLSFIIAFTCFKKPVS